MNREIISDFYEYCKELTIDCCESISKFVSEMIYGIIKKQSVRLSAPEEALGEGSYP